MSSAFEQSGRVRLTVAVFQTLADEPLEATLASVAAVADEILVISTVNHTAGGPVVQPPAAGPANRPATRVIALPWSSDHAALRNAALAQAQGDWVLLLDAGETLAEPSAAPLAEFVKQPSTAKEAWLLLVEVPPAPGADYSERKAQLRLLPRSETVRFTGRALPSPRAALEAARIETRLGAWSIRRGYGESLELKRHRAQRDLELIQHDLAEQGEAADVLVALGELHASLGDDARARQALVRAIAVAQPGSTEALSAYYGLLASCAANDPTYELRVATCVKAIDQFPFDAQLLCAMGSYLQAQGELMLAIRCFRQAQQHGQLVAETWHVAEITEVATICLSLCLQLTADDDHARQVIEETIAEQGSTPRLRQRLLEIHVRNSRVREALEQIDHLSANAAQREALRSAVRGACQAARRNWIAALAYLETAYAAGCRETFCLRWLTITLVSVGNYDAAAPVAAAWHQAEPHDPEVGLYQQAIASRQRPNDAPVERAAATAQLRREEALTKVPAMPATGAAALGAPQGVASPGGISRGVAQHPARPLPATATLGATRLGRDDAPLAAVPAGSPIRAATPTSAAAPTIQPPPARAATPATPAAATTPAAAGPAAAAATGPAAPSMPTFRALPAGSPAEGDDPRRVLRIEAARHPLDASLHVQLGDAYRRQGDALTAEGIWRDFLERAPGETLVLRALCELLVRDDRLPDALELYRQHNAHGQGDSALGLLLQAALAGQAGDWRTALPQLEASRRGGYSGPLLDVWEAKAQLALGNLEAAASLFRAALDNDPRDPAAQAGWGQVAAQLDRASPGRGSPGVPIPRPHLGPHDAATPRPDGAASEGTRRSR